MSASASASATNPTSNTSLYAHPSLAQMKRDAYTATTRSGTTTYQDATTPPRSRSSSDPDPLTERVYTVIPGQRIGDRYEIVKLIGRGTFSQVVMAKDLLAVRNDHSASYPPGTTAAAQASGMVAIKIVRDVSRYRHAAEKEARILQYLANRTISTYPIPQLPQHGAVLNNAGGINPLLGWFRLGGHMCLVFPVLGCSIYDFLRANQFKGFKTHQVKHMALQLLNTTATLHELTVIHADIKPENILFVDASYTTETDGNGANRHIPVSTDIRMVDFGTAVYDTHEKPAIVVSRSYRPPEVVLGLEWSYGVDIWAIACVMMEFHHGNRLFGISGSNGTDAEHIALMEQMLGPLPSQMKQRSRLFTPNGSPAASPSFSTRYIASPVPSPITSPATTPPASPNLKSISIRTVRELLQSCDPLFGDLILKMLRYDPDSRISARECLRHPYFT